MPLIVPVMDLGQDIVTGHVLTEPRKIKLRPRDAGSVVEGIQKQPAERAGRQARRDRGQGDVEEPADGRRGIRRTLEPDADRLGEIADAPKGGKPWQHVGYEEAEAVDARFVHGRERTAGHFGAQAWARRELCHRPFAIHSRAGRHRGRLALAAMPASLRDRRDRHHVDSLIQAAEIIAVHPVLEERHTEASRLVYEVMYEAAARRMSEEDRHRILALLRPCCGELFEAGERGPPIPPELMGLWSRMRGQDPALDPERPPGN